MSTTIEINHTPAEGTLLTGDPRPHHPLVKAAGFRWSRNMGCWYLPSSRDRLPRTSTIERLADQLREVGLEVEVDVELGHRSAAEAETDRAERIEARQDALASEAERKADEYDTLSERERQMHELIPFGQPILVGHHSEKRHRNDLRKMDRLHGKAMEAYSDSREAERKAAASRANEAQRESLPTTVRRVERLEAEGRDIDRKLAGKPCPVSDRKVKPEHHGKTTKCPLCGVEVTYGELVPTHYQRFDEPASGDYRDRIVARKAQIDDDVAFWKAHVESLAEAGVRVLGPADFTVGEKVKANGRVAEVVRVNKKSLTVKDNYVPWTSTVTYERIAKLEPAT